MVYNNKMKFIRENWQKFILIVYVFIIPIISLAAENPLQPIAGTNPSDPNQGKIVDPLGGRFPSISALIQEILEGVLKIGMPIIALAIIYCGFLFVAARGNSEKLTKAKSALTWTLVGAGILLGAWAIAKMISATVTGLGS
jgi:hypothetical protein